MFGINPKDLLFRDMRKLVVFLVLVLGIFHCNAQSYIREEYVCAGSSFTWQIDASASDTIIIKSEFAEENVYDTLVGNEIILYPNDIDPAYYMIMSINGSPLSCQEILFINVLAMPEANITVNNHDLNISMNDRCQYLRIINTSDNSLFHAENWGNPPSSTIVNNVPSGCYNVTITDDSGFNCRTTIPITVP